MQDHLHFAYIDETGNVAISCHNHILIVAALGIENSRTIARIIRKTQKKYGSSLASGELKAKKESKFLIESLLTAFAKEPIEVFSVIMDRQIIEHPPKDPEDIYRWAMARLVKKLVKRHPRTSIGPGLHAALTSSPISISVTPSSAAHYPRTSIGPGLHAALFQEGALPP